MNEFDDFVEEDETDTEKHQPKKERTRETLTDEAETRENSLESRSPSGEMKQDIARTSQSEQPQTEAIADSSPVSWDREQFVMFFKERETFDYEDLLHETKGNLKREYNVRNDKRYELDQAFIELALKRVDSEELAAHLIENRGFDTADR